jgi:ceramide glucosyltransferase
MMLPALLFTLLGGVGVLYTLAAAVLAGRWRPGAIGPVVDAPSVTILKPLFGDEPKLAENLGTFLRQDYPGAVQMVCGVGSADDPAVGGLPASYPSSRRKPGPMDTGEGDDEKRFELEPPTVVSMGPGFRRDDEKNKDHDKGIGENLILSIATHTHGSNGKISNLTNMQPHAIHDLLVLSDSDIAVEPDYLTRIAVAIAQPGVGAVTCLYAGRGDAGLWSRIAAAGISYQFLPSVMIGLATGLAKPCMGSTIALRRETLDAIGGFVRFADILADDHAMGAAVRELGLTIVVPRMIVIHGCTETNFLALARHELRWNATVRALDKAGFIGSIVTHPFALAVIAFAMGGGAMAAWLILAAFLSRMVLAFRIDRLAGRRTMPLWLLPARDIVSFALYIATFFVRSVDWRGAKLRMEKDGRVSAGSES